jgi:hypothetical protein
MISFIKIYFILVHNYFHWAMTYLRTSHVSFPYGGFWLNPDVTAKLGFKPVHLPSDANNILQNKTMRGILWLVSNCNSNSKREVAVGALQKYLLYDFIFLLLQFKIYKCENWWKVWKNIRRSKYLPKE